MEDSGYDESNMWLDITVFIILEFTYLGSFSTLLVVSNIFHLVIYKCGYLIIKGSQRNASQNQ